MALASSYPFFVVWRDGVRPFIPNLENSPDHFEVRLRSVPTEPERLVPKSLRESNPMLRSHSKLAIALLAAVAGLSSAQAPPSDSLRTRSSGGTWQTSAVAYDVELLTTASPGSWVVMIPHLSLTITPQNKTQAWYLLQAFDWLRPKSGGAAELSGLTTHLNAESQLWLQQQMTPGSLVVDPGDIQSRVAEFVAWNGSSGANADLVKGYAQPVISVGGGPPIGLWSAAPTHWSVYSPAPGRSSPLNFWAGCAASSTTPQSIDTRALAIACVKRQSAGSVSGTSTERSTWAADFVDRNDRVGFTISLQAIIIKDPAGLAGSSALTTPGLPTLPAVNPTPKRPRIRITNPVVITMQPGAQSGGGGPTVFTFPAPVPPYPQIYPGAAGEEFNIYFPASTPEILLAAVPVGSPAEGNYAVATLLVSPITGAGTLTLPPDACSGSIYFFTEDQTPVLPCESYLGGALVMIFLPPPLLLN